MRASGYTRLGDDFAKHEPSIIRAKNTVHDRKTATVTTNTVEGYYSIFKRGMKGVYQHCSEKHLHRYLAEFDFRYSNRSGVGLRIWNALISLRLALLESD